MLVLETIAIASDHAGVALKAELVDELSRLGVTALDLGTNSEDSVDYPDMANLVADALKDGRAARGILICGSGLGISMAANRHAHIRAAPCHDSLSARLARQHNNANVLALGARLIGIETAKDCLRAFVETSFEGGRHQRRVAKLEAPAG